MSIKKTYCSNYFISSFINIEKRCAESSITNYKNKADNKCLRNTIFITPKTLIHNLYSIYQIDKIKFTKPSSWIPANGFKYRYIYFPFYYCYYDTYLGCFIYYEEDTWIYSIYQPLFIKNIKETKKIELVIDNTSKPQLHFELHVKLYS